VIGNPGLTFHRFPSAKSRAFGLADEVIECAMGAAHPDAAAWPLVMKDIHAAPAY
jgi:hypothetical protein